MSDPRAMIALTSFSIDGELGEQVVGKHPAVVQTGVSSGAIRQGTQLWSHDPIVQAYPSLFADASIVPGAGQSADDGAADHGGPPQPVELADPAPASPDDDGDTDADEEKYGYSGLTREAILTAKQDHDAEGHNSQATHRRLSVTARTLIRARHHFGLVPWPDD